MANTIIRIKRSGVSGNPPILAQGELAYSWLTDNGSNGGDRLYIGTGTEIDGDAANHVVIGGEFFTKMLDHAKGTLTADSAVIVDSNKKIDEFNVDNIKLDGNAITTTDTNGNLELTPDGTGKVEISSAYTLPNSDGTAGQFLKTDGSGALSFETVVSSFTLNADSGSPDTFNTGETLLFSGGTGISTAVTNNTITISGDDATTSTKGIASFNSTDFSVSSGAVSLVSERIEDIVGGMLSSSPSTQKGISVTYDDTDGTLDFDVDDFTLTFDGDLSGSGTIVDLANQTISLTLDTVNSNVGSFGSTTEIPVVTVNGKGLVTAVSTASISTTLSIEGDSGTDSVSLASGTLDFEGGTGITTTVSDDKVTIAGDDATTSTKGIASFNTNDFSVSSGAVSIKTGGVSNTQLVNDSLTIGSTEITLGGTQTSIAGLTEVTVDNININGNTISTSTGNLNLAPNGSGVVDVSGSRITSVLDPVEPTDATNKQYVDDVAQGLHALPAAEAASTDDLDAMFSGSPRNVTWTDASPSATFEIDADGINNYLLFDDVQIGIGDNVLIKDQTNANENGSYVVTAGGINTTWVLVRCSFCDESSEVPGSFEFVTGGTLYGNTGWVATVDNNGSFQIDVDDIDWVQFSGAGTYTGGDGLDLTGTTFSVNVAATGGIEIVSDELKLKDSVAGDGLTITSGVLDVVGTTDRITANANSIDIASTYVGQTSITTLGTIGTGVWNGTTIGTGYGGTGLTSFTAGDLLYASDSSTLTKLGIGNPGEVLQIGGSPGTLTWGMIDGGSY